MYRLALLNVVFTIGLVAVAVMPFAAHAQTSAYDPGTIVPQCSGAALFSGSSEHQCTFCDFMQLVQNVLDFILFLAIITAGGLFAWAGWLYVTSIDNPTNVKKAHDIFRNGIIGLLLVLGAYTIVDTIIKTLAGGNLLSDWNNLCSG